MSTIAAGNTLTTGLVQTSDITGNLVLSALGNVSLSTTGVTTSANISAGYYIGNGSLLTGIAGGPVWQAVQTGNFTASVGNAYPVNTTSNAVYATLPASPGAGNTIIFVDYARTFGTNNLTLNPNGGKIQSSNANISLTVNGEAVNLVYIDSTQGWINYGGFVNNPVGNYTVTYLVVAGGGGGGGFNSGGGGGAGGYIASTASVTPGTSYSITVGSGGAGSTSTTQGSQGTNSVFGSFSTATGGGGGSKNGSPATGGAGGSGGGAGVDGTTGYSGGAGTAGQGNNGGSSNSSYQAPQYPGGGGGGAGAVGGTPPNSTTGGSGGIGSQWAVTGSYYAGGGGGSVQGGAGVGGAGGNGGGGAGGATISGTSGTINTGGGGGASGGASTNGAAGGSGVVLVAYLGGQRGTGGTISNNAGYTIHTFTSSSTFTA